MGIYQRWSDQNALLMVISVICSEAQTDVNTFISALFMLLFEVKELPGSNENDTWQTLLKRYVEAMSGELEEILMEGEKCIPKYQM